MRLAITPLTSSVIPATAVAPQRGAGALALLRQGWARRDAHFAAAAGLSAAALVPVLLAYALDDRTINGINVWTKPAKFLLSFVVYYATLAWAAAWVPSQARQGAAGRFTVWAALGAGVLEMLWLLAAAAQGVPSHFNLGSPVWRTAYHLAGVGSVLLISVILVQGLQIARDRRGTTPPALRDALVLGAVVAFATTLVTAGFLAQGSGHWVGGVPNDAAGLPLIGWSRTGGDLRVAHFFALHAQQALPLAGVLLAAARVRRARAGVWIAAGSYVGWIAFTFVQALRGQPFL